MGQWSTGVLKGALENRLWSFYDITPLLHHSITPVLKNHLDPLEFFTRLNKSLELDES